MIFLIYNHWSLFGDQTSVFRGRVEKCGSGWPQSHNILLHPPESTKSILLQNKAISTKVAE